MSFQTDSINRQDYSPSLPDSFTTEVEFILNNNLPPMDLITHTSNNQHMDNILEPDGNLSVVDF